MVDGIKGFRQVKKNTAYSFIAVNFHFKIVSEFKNCLISGIIFPEAKLVFKQNVFLFQGMIQLIVLVFQGFQQTERGQQWTVIARVCHCTSLSGITFEILKISGTIPDSIDSLNKFVRGVESRLLAILIRQLGISIVALCLTRPDSANLTQLALNTPGKEKNRTMSCWEESISFYT